MSASAHETLRQLLLAWLASLPEAAAATLLERAHNDALASVHATLRDHLTDLLLKQVEAYLQPAIPTSPLDDAQREMEALRARLAANEAELARLHPTVELDTAPSTDRLDPAPPDATGVYVYGVLAPDSASLALHMAGVDPAYPVYVLDCGGLCALVSHVQLREFGEEELERNLHDPAWLEASARRHQEVLDAAMEQATVVPLTFGTIFHSEARVASMVNEQRSAWQRRLAHLHGRTEWGVKVYCNTDALQQAVQQHDPQLVELRQRIAQANSGAAYMLQKQRDTRLHQAIHEHLDQLARAMHDALLAHAVAGVRHDADRTPLRPATDPLILSAAYLLPTEQVPAFEQELVRLTGVYNTYGVHCDLSGPWVPYHFATLDETNRPDLLEVDV